jgi:hypothetical protein
MGDSSTRTSARRDSSGGAGRLPDAEWDASERHETPAERLDRNYTELLQELRVAQTGVQILFAFLLGIPFTQRFTSTTNFQRGVYFVTLLLAALASALLIGPVSYHRLIFRRHAKARLVNVSNVMAVAGTGALAGAMTGVVLMVADVLFGLVAGVVTAAGVGAVFGTLWYALPLVQRSQWERDGVGGRG